MNKYNLYIDIETIPQNDPELIQEIADGIQAPANYKKASSIQLWNENNKPALVEKAVHGMGLDAGTGKIICMAFALGDGPIHSSILKDNGDAEGVMIECFFKLLSKAIIDIHTDLNIIWTGHNITGFDLRFIWKRCIINGFRPPINIPYDVKPWSDRVYDTCWEWGQGKDKSSMDFVCRALGIEGKDGMDGSKVWDAWKAGLTDDIREYCADDVRRVREIHKAMTFEKIRG